jgi:hypothetical protein
VYLEIPNVTKCGWKRIKFSIYWFSFKREAFSIILTEDFTSFAISIYSFEELLESSLVYTLLTIVTLHDMIRCSAVGLTVVVTGVLDSTVVGCIALVEIFLIVTNVVEIIDVRLPLLISIVLESITCKESLVTFVGKLDRIV